MIGIMTIASAWFGFFSIYLFAAHQLPGYNKNTGKKVFSVPMQGMAISLLFVGFYMAWISDPVTLAAFEYLEFSNSGIADIKVQNYSLFLTIVTAVPLVWAYRKLDLVAKKIDDDESSKRYFVWAGTLMGFLSALFVTSTVLLNWFDNNLA